MDPGVEDLMGEGLQVMMDYLLGMQMTQEDGWSWERIPNQVPKLSVNVESGREVGMVIRRPLESRHIFLLCLWPPAWSPQS